jgi:hypothetical protein
MPLYLPKSDETRESSIRSPNMDNSGADRAAGLHSNESVSVAFSSALSDFRSALLRDCIDESEICSSLPELRTAIGDVERQQSQRKSLQNMARIRPLIEALEDYSRIIEVFVNAKPDLLAFVWGPIKLCVQVCC